MANKRVYKPKPFKQRKLALERINTLFKEAATAFKEDKKLANRYIQLARKISMKYKVRIPSNLKKKFCKHCHSYLKPSINCRVRLQKKKVIYYCLECKKFMRFPYKTKSKAKN